MSAKVTQKGIQTAKEQQDILLPKKAGSIHNDAFQGVFDDEDRLKRLLFSTQNKSCRLFHLK